MNKALIFDSGTLINLSMNGLLDILKKLKDAWGGEFLITEQVKYEVVDRPAGVLRFELGAIRIQNLIDDGILKMPSSIGIDNIKLKEETKEIMDMANHFLQVNEKWIEIVSEAEMSCLALSNELSEKGIRNMIALDERTTRIMCENPPSLERLMSEKLHQRVKMVANDFKIFSKYEFIRSTELVYVAYKKGIIKLNGKKALEALLYATKFKGSSVSYEEIEVLKKI